MLEITLACAQCGAEKNLGFVKLTAPRTLRRLSKALVGFGNTTATTSTCIAASGAPYDCWFPWTHRYGWPQLDRATGKTLETCSACGKQRAAKEPLAVAQRFDVPRFQPVAVESVDGMKSTSASRRVIGMRGGGRKK